MALFGFNKQKVLANAEKYVQQGKLPNAISEYEKILKNDAKDLTVTNTVGDLYSRIGEADKATECFKTVGDAYASQGFTVKAIAMYKKISKLKPSLESLLKLAELYTQQGLFNDARAQYLQVAEEFLKANELENAVRIFQKILEMDPENTTMRVRLAEVYVRLGKKAEAWQIFTAAAESMRSKGSLNGADEILQRMLALEPGNAYALLMQGKNQAESGDAAGAVATLLKVADIDSNPDGLRDLLKAYLQTGQLSEAGATANKLLTVHNDLTAISSFADALMQAGQYDTALQVYDEHAERLLAENSDKVLAHLHSIIGHVRDNPASLEKLLDLFNKAGETTHVSEVIELLAHASVQAGDLPRARDLYQKLAQVEPQNPLHMQNYQQVVSQLSGTSDVKLITPEEAVVLIDDIEATAPSVHQHYSDEVALAVRSALTDAELFISYNMPAKALGPLVTVLPMAPNDLRINQRLAALHTRAGRFADAGVCCRTLQNLYSEAGYPDEATRYGELAERYEERSSVPGTVVAHEEAHIYLDAPAPAPAAHAAEPEVATSESETVPDSEAEPEVEVVEETSEAEAEAAEEVTGEPAEETEFAVVEDSAAVPAEAAATESEIDLSAEWDDSVTVEAETPEAEVAEAEASAAEGDSTKTEETIEEIRFYLANGMPEQAMAALAKLQTLTGDQDLLAELRAEVEAAAQQPSEEVQVETEPVVEELTADDIPTIEVTPEEVPEVIEETAAAAEAEEVPVAEETAAVEPEPEPEREPEPVVSEPAHSPRVLTEFVSDLESSLGDKFLPGKVAKPAKKPVPPPPPAHAPAPAAHAAPVLGQFVADIEASLGEDFLKAAPAAKPQPSAPVVKVVPAAPVVTPATALKTGPAIAASAAASASAPAYVAPPVVVPASPSAPPAWHAPAAEAPAPHAPAAPAPHAPAAAAASPFGEEAGVDLAEMFGELKQDLEADVAAADEDPETHYNLGIAFREMGLLDEAIGELQKACQFFDRGHAFPQIMQTYTWLAQCFLDKGVPEAAVRWYEKALGVPTIDGETRVALNYELASAYETAGDKPAALKHFMDVYGTNIDYRDVAERIKALKS
ncbi:Tetratricopeptide repeat protein (modular protein) [Candidatus Sulfotelmatobacter kueseliae]|uniref:Tetratricopeptide repeat protein (Modular protein) n=1 Tax=Candidatus Sulfotelmatobacter kueseliae TaxID=2042962 RepID=A0A2U3KVI2_9BACT|nr:Tetratricopeptide repeat protein (modular protein) [Candidatus Sulfotelmatobacter kueseliae]